MPIEKVLYRAHAHATGGRDDRAVSSDGILDVRLATPKELGGGGGQATSGFGIEVDLTVNVPGMDKAQANELVQAAHRVCPYSNATRNNIDVRLAVA
jgi:lipoyl-dependent peroxiredoxin